MTQSLVEVVGCTVGGAIAGPPGAITGSIVGKLIALMPGLDDLVSGVAGNVATDILKNYWNRRRPKETAWINHDLQTAFRDALCEGLYDIGGELCFPQEWNKREGRLQSLRDVPDRVVYWRTERGETILNRNHAQKDEICACLRWLDQRIKQNELVPLEPSADQDAAQSYTYLLDRTPTALADHFFEQLIRPELKPFRDLEQHFARHLGTHLLDRTLVHLNEMVKKRTEAWRAFNRLVLEQLRDEVQRLGQAQQTILDQLDHLTSATTSLQWTDELATLIEAYGKLAKDQHESFTAVLAQLTDQHRALTNRLKALFNLAIDIKRDTTFIKEQTTAIDEKVTAIQERLDQIIQPSVAIVPHTIHSPVLDFVGRQQEIDELIADIQVVGRSEKQAGIWWIYGMPGVGKTEFAYAVAQRVSKYFPDGQILLEMQGTSHTPMLAEDALAKVIHAFEKEKILPTNLRDLHQHYTQMLQGKRVLIIADNVEKKTQILPLLRIPAGCALIILSRQRLGVPSARIRELKTMQREEAEAWLTSANLGDYAAPLAKMCGYLPLALRISTTLLQEDPTIDTEDYLRQLKDERLRLSGLQEHDLEEQPDHSVSASIKLSYVALSEPVRQVLQQLSVFVASFEAAAAESIVLLQGEASGVSIPESLTAIFRRSLLTYDLLTKRYTMHDLVRVFALERLQAEGDEAATRKRHAEYYADQAEYASERLTRSDQAHWLRYLDAEYSNLLAAADWSQNHGLIEIAARIISSLWRFWTIRGAVGEDGTSSLGQGRAWLEHVLTSFAKPAHPQTIQLRAKLLNSLGLIAFSQKDYDRALTAFEENLRNYQGDQRGYVATLVNLAMVAEQKGNYDQAFDWYQQGLSVFQVLDDKTRAASTLHNIGVLKYTQKEYSQAEQFHKESLALRRSEDDTGGIARSLENLGWVALAQNDIPKAKQQFTEAIQLAWDLADQEQLVYCLEGLCDVAQTEQHAEWAARLWGAAEKLRREIGAPIQDSDLERYTNMVHAIRAALGDEAFASASQQSYNTSLETIVREVLQQP